MNDQGSVLLNALLELITRLIPAPCRFVAWLIRGDDTAAQLDAQAAALRQSSADIDRSERDPAETLVQIMRRYLRRGRRLGSVARLGDEVCAWGWPLAMRDSMRVTFRETTRASRCTYAAVTAACRNRR